MYIGTSSASARAEHRREVGVIEELAADGSVGHATHEAQLAHRVFELVGARPPGTLRGNVAKARKRAG